MGKYDGLTEHLRRRREAGLSELTMRFSEIERLVGPLPPTASNARQWWANSSHAQALAWHRAGWHVDAVDFAAGWVRFALGSRGGTRAARLGTMTEHPAAAAATPTQPRPVVVDATRATATHAHAHSWHWEGNVQTAVVNHLLATGWLVVSQADTASQARGVDIVAERGEDRLLVEVKGFPATTYARGERAGTLKPTAPSVQAKHWLAEAVLSCMRLRSREPQAGVALAVPSFPRYRKLMIEVSPSLKAAGIGWIWVHEGGEVDMTALPVGTRDGL